MPTAWSVTVDVPIPVGADDLALVERLLTLARLHLGAEVAWASVLVQQRQVILAASGETTAMNVAAGAAPPADGSYCVRVLAGQLPPVVADARTDHVTRDLEVTRDLRIGSYAGVPWRTSDGSLAGMLCCVSRHPDPALQDRTLDYLRVAAAMVGDLVSTGGRGQDRAVAELERLVAALFGPGGLRTVYQPVVRLGDGARVAVEALSRFDPELFATPDRAFAAATRFRRGVDLELLAVQRALARLPDLAPGLTMCVNLSAEALTDARVQTELLRHAGHRIAVEVTEHTQVDDYLTLISVTERLRAAGLMIAVDDAGAGYASLRHILQLKPDVIKLDIGLVRGIDQDSARQALARSLVGFAGDIGALLVAEGVETEAELNRLRELGVRYGQGFLLEKPAPLDSLPRVLAR